MQSRWGPHAAAFEDAALGLDARGVGAFRRGVCTAP